jgi:hypothetical protein
MVVALTISSVYIAIRPGKVLCESVHAELNRLSSYRHQRSRRQLIQMTATHPSQSFPGVDLCFRPGLTWRIQRNVAGWTRRFGTPALYLRFTVPRVVLDILNNESDNQGFYDHDDQQMASYPLVPVSILRKRKVSSTIQCLMELFF